MRSLLLTIWFFITIFSVSANFFPNISSVPPRLLRNYTRGAWDGFRSFAGCHHGDNAVGLSSLKRYFNRFGYLSDLPANITDDFDDVLESAIKTYQKNFNLKVTGKLDVPTILHIVRPRCGNADVINGTTTMNAGTTSAGIHAVQRYTFFPGKPRWPEGKRDLTYAFSARNNLTEDVKQVFERAFGRWAAVTPLTFSQSNSEIRADILIGFFSGEHGDGEPFDGAMGTLAHASSPPSGMLHLDSDEDWVISSDGDIRRLLPLSAVVDLESVVVHEIGHLLGLGHSSAEDAIMYPTITGGDRRVELATDDIEGIQHLYGENPNGSGASSSSAPSSSNQTETSNSGDCSYGYHRLGLSVVVLAAGFLFQLS